MTLRRLLKLTPLIFGAGFFGVYTARCLFDVPVPNLLADGVILGICGLALLVGVHNARVGGKCWVTLAQPLVIAVTFVGAEFIRQMLNYRHRIVGPTLQTYVTAILLAVVLGSIAYGVGTLLGIRPTVGR